MSDEDKKECSTTSFNNPNEPDQDIIIRLYLRFVNIYIEFYKYFDNPFLDFWRNKIKPYLIIKYPTGFTGIFNQNSDIQFLVKIIDELDSKYGVKVINNMVDILNK